MILLLYFLKLLNNKNPSKNIKNTLILFLIVAYMAPWNFHCKTDITHKAKFFSVKKIHNAKIYFLKIITHIYTRTHAHGLRRFIITVRTEGLLHARGARTVTMEINHVIRDKTVAREVKESVLVKLRLLLHKVLINKQNFKHFHLFILTI